MFEQRKSRQPLPDCLSDNVVGLDEGIRLEAKRTRRSTCYREKMDRLQPSQRPLVEIMERKLFDERRRVASCQRGELHLPDSRFDCPEGSIWYHFSADSAQFVLSDFHLNDRGSDTSEDDLPDSDWSGVACIGVGGWGSGIAAQLGRLCAIDWSHTDLDLVAWLGREHRSRFDVRIDDKLVVLGDSHVEGRFLIDIAMSMHLMTDIESNACLPAWSLLHRVSDRREQLENSYARAIFAGEALCRIGTEIGNHGAATRAMRWAPLLEDDPSPVRKVSNHALLDETIAILKAVHRGAGRRLRRRARHYLTASLMDGDMLGDVRRLALIRSEMTFRFAMAVSAPPVAPRCNAGADVNAAFGDQLHRYALLSEFVRLSAGYFGVDEAVGGTLEVVDELGACLHRGKPVIERLVHDLDDFGTSSTLIVDHLAPMSMAEDHIDFGALYPRLCGLAEAILDDATEPRKSHPVQSLWLHYGGSSSVITSPVEKEH